MGVKNQLIAYYSTHDTQNDKNMFREKKLHVHIFKKVCKKLFLIADWCYNGFKEPSERIFKVAVQINSTDVSFAAG